MPAPVVFAATQPPRAPRRIAAVCALLGLLAGCGDAAPPPPPEVRPVRIVTVEKQPSGETVSLTGTVQAETEVNLAFRIEGRMTQRYVNVGDTVVAGQVVARLDRENEENSWRSAHAALVASRGRLVEAQNDYVRQRDLLAAGFAPRARYDQAVQQLQSAKSAADSAQAQLGIAENRLSWTDLVADAPGTVTARGAEIGEVVQAGRMIVQLAREGGIDAVLDVPAQLRDMAPADPRIYVSLTMDPAVRAIGRVREVSPRADPVTGTFQVRVGLIDPPPSLRLGSTITARMSIDAGAAIQVPASALTRAAGQPAVWVVDAANQTVSLRNIEVLRFDPTRIVVAEGLAAGDLVVTAGVQALRPGQKVRLLGGAAR